MWNDGGLSQLQGQEVDRLRSPLHNINHTTNYFPSGGQSLDSASSNAGRHRSQQEDDGTWGERDVGGPIDPRTAMEDYEALRKSLTSHSRSKSKASVHQPTLGGATRRTLSMTETDPGDLEAAAPAADEDEEEFQLDEFMREGHFEKRIDGRSAKKVGVVFKDLTVKGVGSTSVYVKTLPDAILGTFGPDLYRILKRFIPFLRFGKPPATRVLINSFTGLVRDGEMMLVLGRPGAGCSTFLKAIANNREEFAEVSGTVSYGGIDAAIQKKKYRGEVNYNPEDDIHFPDLNVWQTFVFALLNKTKKREKGEIPIIVNALLRMFGIPHTKYTKVGNAFVRGVSGGERKRVSIAETLATKCTVLCWDNSTRGLDASTALDYAKALRIMTDVSDKTTLTTLYQAGEGIYEIMDKVLVIDQGRCIYQGPAKEAKQYFIDLGFHCPERLTTADFLTACTDVNERQFRAGFEVRAPKSPEELEQAFLNSPNYQKVLEEVARYEREIAESDHADAKEFQQTVRESKSNKTVSKDSSYTVSFSRQVLACARREAWLLLGDKITLYTKFWIIMANAFLVGSLFYNQPFTTASTFSRGGALFFSIIFLGWLQLSELMKAVTGRQVVQRQRDYAFYSPSAVSLGRVLVDFPMLVPQVTLFTVIVYFMADFERTASQFFIYFLFVYITTFCITSLYRMFAALSPGIDEAVRFSGVALNILVIYVGYVIPKPQLTTEYTWFGWIYYINPMSYGFEAVLTNELSSQNMPCAAEQLVPSGPGSNPDYQGCAITGSTVNSKIVSGAAYLETIYSYSRSHLWRNFGVIIALSILYILITIVATELFDFAPSGGGATVFKKSSKSKKRVAIAAPADEEKAGKIEDSSDSSYHEGSIGKEVLQDISGSKSIFTWEDVCYTVPYQGGQKQLLNNVSGYAKPGVMVALMGASGAGKTTLLNVLAQRQNTGVVSGNMLVDGRECGRDFNRGTGFCEQLDVHDGTATVREALEFSALLRQSRETPKQEKLDYVNKVISLLELEELEDAIISSLGVEQRKRLTIGVELAAKPSLLLFLDEPTSGLDSQSAYSIIRFLKKLTQAGQAIICTIHQPSSVLIQQFDMILALNPGGNTFYYGPVGENGVAVIQYFADRGFNCPPGKNVAEFILEMAAKPRRGADGKRINWNEEWRKSDNAKVLKEAIQKYKEERSQLAAPSKSDVREFAAPVWTQTTLLLQRTFRQQWRDPSYLYGKLFVAVLNGIFNGFTFWQLGYSSQDLQNRMFSVFLIIVIPPAVVNGIIPKFYGNLSIWQTRELPSRIYGWVAFTTAQAVSEIPMAIVQSIVYFLLWYYPVGFPTDSSTAGYVFLMTMLFFLFMASWGQWITAFAPSFTVIANVIPFFFVITGLFNGVIRPYSLLPSIWKYFVYYAVPSTWWIGGVLSATLRGVPVECSPSETAKFFAPPNQTCGEYAGSFAQRSGGYLLQPDSRGTCEYCQYSTGDSYLATLNINPGDKWRDLGIFCVYVVVNYALIYFFIYTVRIKKWSFGFGILFGALGKGVDVVFSPLQKMIDRRRMKQDAEISAKTTAGRE